MYNLCHCLATRNTIRFNIPFILYILIYTGQNKYDASFLHKYICYTESWRNIISPLFWHFIFTKVIWNIRVDLF